MFIEAHTFDIEIRKCLLTLNYNRLVNKNKCHFISREDNELISFTYLVRSF